LAVKAKRKGANEKKKGIGGVIIIGIICLLLLFITFAVFVVGFNALGIRDKYLADRLRGVPFINNLLPPEETDEPIINGENGEGNGYENGVENGGEEEETFEDWEIDDFINRLTQLNGIINSLRIQITELTDEISGLHTRDTQRLELIDSISERLEEFNEMHNSFRTVQTAFERQVAMGDPIAYQEFFEQFNPEHASQLYQDVVRHNIDVQLLNDYIAIVSRMDASAAAAMLQEMMETEINLVARILDHLSVSRRSAIMQELTPAHAARIMIAMAPGSIID
jgi:hypothetical protein